MNAQNNISATSDLKKDVTFGKLTVDSVGPNEMNSKYFSAQLRQVVDTITHYPGGAPNSGLNDGLFDVSAFELKPTSLPSTQNRIAWIDVPVGTTQEQVEGLLAKKAGAKIVRITSSTPILSDNHKSMIAQGTLTLEKVAARQLLRVPDTAETNPGGVALDRNGKFQYAVNVFTTDASRQDEDRRTADKADTYVLEMFKEEEVEIN